MPPKPFPSRRDGQSWAASRTAQAKRVLGNLYLDGGNNSQNGTLSRPMQLHHSGCYLARTALVLPCFTVHLENQELGGGPSRRNVEP